MSTNAPTTSSASAAGGPLVIKVGGTTLESHAQQPTLWRALVGLHDATLAASREHGGVVLVHGGGKVVDARLARLGIVSEKREGIRVTTDEQITELVATLAGVVNTELVGTMLRAGARAVGLSLGDGHIVRASKATRFAFDPGHVGDVTAGDPALVRTLLSAGFFPVVSSVALDEQGRPLNVNADDAAAALAKVLRARALVLLTDVPGIKDKASKVIPEVDPARIEALIADGTISGGMIPKARSAARAATDSRVPVVILSGDDPATLERFLSGQPLGTRVLPGAAEDRA
jgi:acetylglutamate kinase